MADLIASAFDVSGRDSEVLHPASAVYGEPDAARALRRALEGGRIAKDVYLWKLHAEHLAAFFDHTGCDFVKHAMAFGAVLPVRLDRKDRIAQAVSLEIARQTSAWRSDQAVRAIEPVFDVEKIREALLRLARSDLFWDLYSERTQLDPVSISYEEILQDEVSALEPIFDFLGLQQPPTLKSDLEIQRDVTSRKWRGILQKDAKVLELEPLELVAQIFGTARRTPTLERKTFWYKVRKAFR
ncbi:MAG: Stf0 family sulfotransferase [Rubricella sp.]